jgi:hypothetical protein
MDRIEERIKSSILSILPSCYFSPLYLYGRDFVLMRLTTCVMTATHPPVRELNRGSFHAKNNTKNFC